MSTHAIVKVLLHGDRAVESPIMTREEAEQAVEGIDQCRTHNEEVSLPWLRVNGGNIEAISLEERRRPASEHVN